MPQRGGAATGWVAGADGCRGGWVVVLQHLPEGRWTARRMAAVAEMLAAPERPDVLAVDLPMGLPDRAAPGGRACDREARRLLGPLRGRSVFSPPARPTLGARDYPEALALNRAGSPEGVGLSRQAFGLFPKLREVDALLTPALQARVFEAHPELAFRALNGGAPVLAPKRTRAGREARLRLLAPWFGGDRAAFEAAHRRLGAAWDDLVDALAVCWTAGRIRVGAAVRLPAAPPRDARGLRMEIWY